MKKHIHGVRHSYSKRAKKRQRDLQFLDRSFLGDYAFQGRVVFSAKFDRFGMKTLSAATKERTFVVQNVESDRDYVCQHVWLHYSQCQNIMAFESKLKRGSIVTFEGEVYTYVHDFISKTSGNSCFGRAKYGIKDVKILSVR